MGFDGIRWDPNEYLRSSGPIIHQSPFNQEAIRLYPSLTVLLNKKLCKVKPINPLYSPTLIRIFYRWWAYLPLWTGLLCNFKERYAKNIQKITSTTFNHIRHSNALIESYFRTMEKSIFQEQVYSRPYLAINDLYPCINTQFKANDESEDSTTASSNKQSSSSSRSRNTDNDTSSSSSLSERKNSVSSSLNADSPVSNNFATDIVMNLDTPVGDENGQNDISCEGEFGSDSNSSMASTVYPSVNSTNLPTQHYLSQTSPLKDTFHPETTVFGETLRWSKFQTKNALFEGRRYTLTFTCPIDTALFALYFIYRVNDFVCEEMNDALGTSPYATLVKTFRIVDKDGWDAARISWLLHFNLLKTSDRTKSLFGSVDEIVFCFLKNTQRHSTTITCTNPHCTQRKRVISSTEIGL
ncbi:unnamed protein product [Adineta ricciae]|uniref:Uncharacterized protein n=1 Tax=Adineta ricciae TaxID=249248 RepID=A0A816GBR5_ADIRI|nr:unnamed protein product [Adineta ricciae]CAF1672104.1 unnamed protein product [Adineta ricciae]